jgi:hypothetical protein
MHGRGVAHRETSNFTRPLREYLLLSRLDFRAHGRNGAPLLVCVFVHEFGMKTARGIRTSTFHHSIDFPNKLREINTIHDT